jgi:hypothetical protein
MVSDDKVADVSTVDLYVVLEDEWKEVLNIINPTFQLGTKTLNKQWKLFIERKDLGIVQKLLHNKEVYVITDERKWFLAKLKYGI